MFADSFCDSAWSDRSRRGWSTLASFAAQTLVVAILLFLPLLYLPGLPRLTLFRSILLPPPAPAPAPPHSASRTGQSNLIGTHLMAPTQIPRLVNQVTDAVAPAPEIDLSTVGVTHGMGDAQGRGTVFGLGNSGPLVPPPPPPAHHPPVSHMMEGNLIQRVEPRYPPLAIQARIQGLVILRAVISRSGLIENLQLVSGHPLLARAAMEAVGQWRYRPYVLNGEPVEVETEVKVNFTLGKD